MKRKAIFWLLPVALVGLQLWRPKLERTPEDPALSFFAHATVPPEIREWIETSCADCHSQRTDWPWYAHVTPVGQWLVGHVNEGSSHFSLSRFGEYPARRQQKVFHEIAHEVESEAMPLPSYLWLHGEARLDAAQRQRIVDWAKSKAAEADAEGAEEGGSQL